MREINSLYTEEELIEIIDRYERVPSAWKFFPEIFGLRRDEKKYSPDDRQSGQDLEMQ